MNWNRESKGHYTSENGRFTIRNIRKEWVLFDNEVTDQFGQPTTQTNGTLRGAKLDAKRRIKN